MLEQSYIRKYIFMSVKVISLKKMLITEPKQCKLLWTKPAQNILIFILCNVKVNFVYELVLSWFYKTVCDKSG